LEIIPTDRARVGREKNHGAGETSNRFTNLKKSVAKAALAASHLPMA
jgi:hypothetical protein